MSSSPKICLAFKESITYLRRMVKEPLSEGVKLATRAVGGTVALARCLNISSQAVSQWDKIPAERVPEVAKATGIPRHLLRPDLYDRPNVEQRASA